MDATGSWSIGPKRERLAQAVPPAGTATDPAADAGQVEVGTSLPGNFGVRIGTLSILNYTLAKLAEEAPNKIPPANVNAELAAIRMNFERANKLQDGDFLRAVTAGAGNKTRVLPDDAMLNAFFDVLKETYNEPEVDKERALAIQYAPAPSGKGLQQTWDHVAGQITAAYNMAAKKYKTTVVPNTPYAPVPTAASTGRTVTAQAETVPTEQGPLSAGRYESVSQLETDLLRMGYGPDAYNHLMSMVGPERENDAKEALASFWQGSPAALSTLYDMLVEKGLASPIDVEIVEKIMSQHPELAKTPDAGSAAPQPTQPEGVQPDAVAGLWMPLQNPSSGLMTKEASGGIGGPSPAYFTHGPGENRFCPKIRNVVNTYVCRYHCLDGLAIDDHQILCGEAIWRQAVMDKFSREYRDADGNWVGGYINKRFEIHRDDGGHPALLKPGKRAAPIHEDAWSLEKRLQEMRRSEGDKRGYSETPGDPENLYNFDQHDLVKGPKNPQLSEKKKDPIAKLAQVGPNWTGNQGQDIQDLAKQDPQEFGSDPKADAQQMLDEHRNTGQPLTEDEVRAITSSGLANENSFTMKDNGLYWETNRPNNPNRPGLADQWYEEDRGIHPVASFNSREAKGKKKKDWDPNPWAVCHTTVDKAKDPEKFEKCVMDVKSKQASAGSWSMEKKAWGFDPMMENTDYSGSMKCMDCGMNLAKNAKQCVNPKCMSLNVRQRPMREIIRDTKAVEGPEIKIPAASDAEIKQACGVFRATRRGFSAFGDTSEEALFKLSQIEDLGEIEPLSVDEEADALLSARQSEKDISQNPQNPVQEQAQVPVPPVPMPVPTDMATEPTQEKISPGAVPLDMASPVPQEIQGGVSEFVSPIEMAMSPEEENLGLDEGHVAADDLDGHIEETKAGMHPSDHAELEAQAIGMGAHPVQER